MQKNRLPLLVLITAGLLISLAVGIASAAPVTQSISYQGKLTDPAGNPLTGTYSVTFKLYDVASGGTALSTDTHSVTATNGLFTTTISVTNPAIVDGRALWLGVKVGTDPEMTPRQEIRPVPYALSLRPGAAISGSGPTPVLSVSNGAGTAVYGIGKEGGYFTTNQGGTNWWTDRRPAINVSTVYQYNPGMYVDTLTLNSPGIYSTTHGDNSQGFATMTYGIGSPGFNAVTAGLNSPAVRVESAQDVGVNAKGVTGIYGTGTIGVNGSGVLYGVSGYSSSGRGIYGVSPSGPGVFGSSTSMDGVTGGSRDLYGVSGYSTNSIGVYGSGLADTGVKGIGKTGVAGESTTGTGVYGKGKTGGNFTTIQAGTLSNPLPALNLLTQFYQNPGARITTAGDQSHGISISTSGTSSNGMYARTTGDNSFGADIYSQKSIGLRAQGNPGAYFSASAAGSSGAPVVAVQVENSGDYQPGVDVATSGRYSSGFRAVTSGYESPGVVVLTDHLSSPGLNITTSGTASDGITIFTHGVYSHGLSIHAENINSNGVYASSRYGNGIRAYSENDNGIFAETGSSSAYAADFKGNVNIRSRSNGASVMQLGEGLDYSEGFDIAGSGKVAPGTVLIISPDDPGSLTVSSEPYDRKVAGIVSGANGLGSAVRIGGDQFDTNVALAGRVYCNVDATYGAVKPGDMLTTSATPGYAMVVQDYNRAQGATIGKAMQGLEEGQKDLILVLVTLQ